MQKTLIVESTKDGKKVQKAYGYLNPEATDAQLEGFAQMTNALTTNEYVGAGVVTRRAVDEPDSGGGAAVPADFAQIVIDNVGSQFTPAVTTPADFVENAPFNVQYFDNNIKHILDGGQNYEVEPTTDCVLLNGTCTVTPVTVKSGDGDYWYLKRSDTEQTKRIDTDGNYNGCRDKENESKWTWEIIKMTELSGYAIGKCERFNSSNSKWYRGITVMVPFALLDDGSIHQDADTTLNIVDASDATTGAGYAITSGFMRSLLNPNSIAFITYYSIPDGVSNHGFDVKETICRGNPTYPKVFTLKKVGTDVADTQSSCPVFTCDFVQAYSPVISFNGQDVSLAKGENPRSLPLTKYEIDKDTGTYQQKRKVIGIPDGVGLSTVAAYDYCTAPSFEITKPWLEDDGNIILGVYPTKNHSDCYAVTYKEGTYSKDSWLDDAFTVWRLERDTPAVVQTDKSITDIADRVI